MVHIQDVHRNAEAQANIGRCVQALMSRSSVGLVALEGAFDPIDLSHWRRYADREDLAMVADYLLESNRISGPVHGALITSREIPPLLGIDDERDYQANVDAYRRSAPQAAEY